MPRRPGAIGSTPASTDAPGRQAARANSPTSPMRSRPSGSHFRAPGPHASSASSSTRWRCRPVIWRLRISARSVSDDRDLSASGPAMNTLLEICVDDAAGIDAAVAGGADRLELCASLELGGLTPSAALVERAVATGCPVHMMIRPTSGDFVLDGAAIALMQEEIRLGAWRGIVGVVVGATRPEGGLDYDALARFREAARDMRIVLHRAIDL